MMSRSRHIRTGRRLIGAITAAMLVQGCAGGATPFGAFKPTEPAQEQVVVPEPTPTTTTQLAPAPQPVKPIKRITPVKAETAANLDLDVTYFARILVPAGSELAIRAQGAGTPSVKTVKTQAGPPYAVTLPVQGSGDTYPMTINATLTSTNGHVMQGEVTLAEEPTGPVKIVLVPKANS